jgi:hypothetical protein
MTARICLVCEAPLVDDTKVMPNRRYCSPECGHWVYEFKRYASREVAFAVMHYMEENTPATLRRILEAMQKPKPGRRADFPGMRRAMLRELVKVTPQEFGTVRTQTMHAAPQPNGQQESV